MLVRLFRQNQPAALFLLLPMLALLWPGAGTGFFAPLGRTAPGMPLYQALYLLMSAAPWLPALCSAVIVFGLAVQLNFTASESDLYERRNHLPALLLPLLLAFFPHGLVPDPAMAGMPFVLWALRRCWASQSDPRVLGAQFDAGCLLGLAALFHLPYAFLIVVLWSTMAITRPFRWREHLVPFLGLITVLFIAWGVLHLFAPGMWQPAASLRAPAATAPWHRPHWVHGVLLATLALAFIIPGVFSFSAVYARGVMREKNTRASFLAFMFSSALLVVFAWFLELRVPAALVAVPLAVFLSWPLLHTRRMAWAEAGVLAMFGLALWSRWG